MTRALSHRGPDDEGYFIEGAVALGHRRLSIIDLETGAQPMKNEDGSIVVVHNGEIYNFKTLRKELETRGHEFATNSDTEVIVHAYEEYGSACLSRLNGMFAFALWDATKKRLFAARDRMGQKPFHYALCDGTFVFGSELKALLRYPKIRPRVTPRTISRYLGFGYLPAPATIYEGIYKLPPAHYLTFSEGRVNVQPYWEIDFDRADLKGLSGSELVGNFLDRFREAVRLRLISDVPLGVFLSGGIDSSAVVAMMCELMPPKQVKTFSIAFREKQYDESPHARTVAEHFGTDHHEKVLEESSMLERLPGLMAGVDEPFADESLSPTSLVSEFARSEVTVALGGDGGDELFAGYGTFRLDRFADRYARVPAVLRRCGEAPARWVFDAVGFSRWRRAVEYVGRAAAAPAAWRVMRWSEAALDAEEQSRVLAFSDRHEPRAEVVYDETIRLHEAAPRRSRLSRVQYQFQKQYLPDDILTKVDRASMAYALEVRAPFLDPRVVDFANALPDRWKLRGRRTKVLLREALKGRLPLSILERGKMGFGIPLAEWLRTGLGPAMERSLAPDRLRDQGIFRPEPMRRAWQEHLSGRRNRRGLLWTFLAFQLWFEHHRPSLAGFD